MVSSVIGAALLGVVLVAGQKAGDATSSAAPANWTVPHMAWGDPDIEGIWGVGYVFTPLERPKELAGKEFLTDAEIAALQKDHTAKTSGDGTAGRARGERGSVADVEGAYNQAFSAFGKHETVIRTQRTSLIVDPPDGRIPPLTPEGRKRRDALRRDTTDEFGPAGPADDPEQRRSDRCMGNTVPYIKGVGAGFRRIVQTPGTVTFFHEDGHVGGVYRAIPIGSRPHLPAKVRQYLGDSVGRWDGDTLVVDVTNFSNLTNFEGSAENLHVTERYTRTGPDLIMMRVTIEDPTTFTKPWTIEVPLTKADEKANQIYESSCHEGNYAMTSILAGARTLEKEKQQRAKTNAVSSTKTAPSTPAAPKQ
jgi:hypothetical protein